MAGPEDFFKGPVLAGLVVGLGAVVIAPLVLPAFAAVSRPLAKTTIKTGMVLFEKGRETIAEMAEVFEDLLAEARAEIGTPDEPATAAAMPAASAAAAHAAEGSASAQPAQTHEPR